MDPEVVGLFKMHLMQHAQAAAYDSQFATNAMRLAHISGSINQEEALGTRIALESGSGRERMLSTPPGT